MMVVVKRYKGRSLGDGGGGVVVVDDDDEVYGRDVGAGETGWSEGWCIHGGIE